MKTIKSGLLILTIALFTFSVTTAQEKEEENKNKMYNIHVDNVNFNKIMDYEKAAKELKDNFVKHNVQDVSWTIIRTENGKYISIEEIENMADLDKNTMAPLFENMGEEAASDLFKRMNECYDSHYSHISHYLDGLSYHPEGHSNEGKNYFEHHFLYYKPSNASAMGKAMKGVKDLFTSKDIKNGYSVYHSGYGSEEAYFLVVIRAKDDLEIAQNGKIHDELIGEDGKPVFGELFKHTSRYIQTDGVVRPDLSYYPKKD